MWVMIEGFANAIEPANLFATFLGAVIGTAIGVLPGLGPSATIAILMPLTFTMSPTAALAMLAGVYYGSQYGGSTTAILLNLPGEGSSVPTSIDGYKLAQQGRGGPALGMAAMASFIGGTIGVVLMSGLSNVLADFALTMGPPEYASLMLFGLLTASNLGVDKLRSTAMCLLGLFISCIGLDVFTGTGRFTLGSLSLIDGIDFVAATMGVFALSEVLLSTNLKQGALIKADTRFRNLLPTLVDWSRSAFSILRGTVVGFLMGVLPGAGAAPATFLAYTVEKKVSRHREEIGHGSMPAVAAAESANNASTAGAMVPLLSLGIPGSPATAVLAGAFFIYGLKPGPFLFTESAGFVWTLIATMYVGNVMLLILNLPLIALWIRLVQIPYGFLGPVVVLISMIGVFALNMSIFDAWVLLAFGAFGFVARQYGFSPAPLVLGLVLGPLFEQNIRRSLLMSNGDPMIFFERPLTLILLGLAALITFPGLLVRVWGILPKKITGFLQR